MFHNDSNSYLFIWFQPANNALQHYLRQQPPDLLQFLTSGDNQGKSPQEIAQRLASALSAQAAAQVAAVTARTSAESNNNQNSNNQSAKKPRLNNNVDPIAEQDGDDQEQGELTIIKILISHLFFMSKFMRFMLIAIQLELV